MPQRRRTGNISQQTRSPIQNQDLPEEENIYLNLGNSEVWKCFCFWLSRRVSIWMWKQYSTGHFLYKNTVDSSTLLPCLKLPSLSFFFPSSLGTPFMGTPFKGCEFILFFCRWQKAGFHNENICSAGVFIGPAAGWGSGAPLGTVSRTRGSTRIQPERGTSSMWMWRDTVPMLLHFRFPNAEEN